MDIKCNETYTSGYDSYQYNRNNYHLTKHTNYESNMLHDKPTFIPGEAVLVAPMLTKIIRSQIAQ